MGLSPNSELTSLTIKGTKFNILDPGQDPEVSMSVGEGERVVFEFVDKAGKTYSAKMTVLSSGDDLECSVATNNTRVTTSNLFWTNDRGELIKESNKVSKSTEPSYCHAELVENVSEKHYGFVGK